MSKKKEEKRKIVKNLSDNVAKEIRSIRFSMNGVNVIWASDKWETIAGVRFRNPATLSFDH